MLKIKKKELQNVIADKQQEIVYNMKIKAVMRLLVEKLKHLGVDIEGKTIIIKSGEITIK